MQTTWQQPSLDMEWNMQQPYQQYPSAFQFLALANETPSRVYKRRASSRVSKPSSAGNSPHSLPRRRTMTSQLWATKPEAAHPVAGNVAVMNNGRKSRPTSWHPSSRYATFNPYAQQQQQQQQQQQNCHPSWLNHDSAANMGLQQDNSTFGSALSTPITCPVSGDLISNDSFAMLDNYYGASTMTQTQTYAPVESVDMMYPGWSNMAFADQIWTHHPSSGGYLAAADQVADFCCHESVSSSDPSTAPATPDVTAFSHPVYKNDEHSILPQAAAAAARGDNLVALGLYDEPQVLSLGSSLLGGTLDSLPQAGKGLKLEETFSPAPVAEEDDDDAEHDED